MKKNLLYEFKIMKQLVYKLKNQLGKTVQYRKMMQVYKCLKKYLSGQYVGDLLDIIENASLSVIESISKKFLVPVFTVLLSLYSSIYKKIGDNIKPVRSVITSRKLKKIIKISKNAKYFYHKIEKNKLDKVETMFEEIRQSLN